MNALVVGHAEPAAALTSALSECGVEAELHAVPRPPDDRAVASLAESRSSWSGASPTSARLGDRRGRPATRRWRSRSRRRSCGVPLVAWRRGGERSAGRARARPRTGSCGRSRTSTPARWATEPPRSRPPSGSRPANLTNCAHEGRDHRPGLRRPAAGGRLRRGGLRRGRASTSIPAWSRRLRRGESDVEDVPSERLARRRRALHGDHRARGARRTATRSSSACRRRSPTSASPTSPTSLDAAPFALGGAARGPARRARVDDLSGHHPRPAAPDPGGVGPARRHATSTSPSRRSGSTRAAPTTRSAPPRRSSAASPSLPRPRRRALRADLRRGRRGLVARGGRAGEAAREHLPLGQHRAGQRAGDALRPDGHRHLGGRRRRRDQAVRVHALRARARGWAATACRSTRSTSRSRRASTTSRPSSSSWRARSTSSSRTSASSKVERALNDVGQAGPGLARPPARRRPTRPASATSARPRR